MNRQERRKNDKENKKKISNTQDAMKWISSLPNDKAKLIKEYSNYIANRDNVYLIQAIERCFSAAIIDVIDLELDTIHNILDTCSEFLKEDGTKMENEKKKYGGNYDMVLKKINASEEVVSNRIKELIGQGLGQKVIVETIYIEFPTLSKAMVTNAVKKVKSELKVKEVINDLEVETKVEPVTEVVEPTNFFSLESPPFAIESAEEPTNDVPNFKIINEVIIRDVEGEYGVYHIENNSVSIGELEVSSKEDINVWVDSEKAILLEEINKLQGKMQELYYKEAELVEVMKSFM